MIVLTRQLAGPLKKRLTQPGNSGVTQGIPVIDCGAEQVVGGAKFNGRRIDLSDQGLRNSYTAQQLVQDQLVLGAFVRPSTRY